MKKTDQNTDSTAKKSKGSWLGQYTIKSSYFKFVFSIIVFIGLGFLAYSNTFNSPFVFDDKWRILENPAIRVERLNVNNIWNAAFGKYSARSRPIGNISFAINYYLHQYEPAGYHLVNIMIHITSGVLLWLFLKITLGLTAGPSEKKGGEWIALAAALLWLVNPVQTQSVTYIVQRLNSMAAMFFLLSFICYLKGRLAASRGQMWAWFLGAAFIWFLALGCKQNTVTLPFFVLLYEWYFFQDLSRNWFIRNLKYLYAILAIFIIISFIYLGSNPMDRITSIGDFANKEFTLSERLMTQFRVVLYYLSLIVLPNPSRLNLDYDFPLSYSLFNPLSTLLSLGVIVGLIAAAVYLARRQRLISFCILWFFGNLAIESSVIPLAIIFEHRIYLPSMMAGLVPVLLAYRYVKFEWLRTGLLCLVVALFSYWTFERNKVWESKITLWNDCIKKSPNKARPYYSLGEAYAFSEMPDEAIPMFLRSLDIDSSNAAAHHNLAVILAKKGKRDEAIVHYQKALEFNPGSVETHIGLGVQRLKQKNFPEAINHYRKALQLQPENAKAHFNLGDALAKQGQTKQAIKHLYRAVQINPDNAQAHNNLGGQLLSQGNFDDALVHFNRALAINPDLAEAHNNLGIIMIRQGRLDAAVSHFRDAVRLDPDFTQAKNNLARALAISRSKNSEIAGIQKELDSRPDDPVLHFKLGNLYLGQRELKQAVIEFEKSVALRPDFLGARNNLAMAYAADRQYDQALTAFKKLVELDPDNAAAYYNIAVLYALQSNVPDSIAWLKQAIDKGYRNWELIKTDKDLANIRHSQDYRQLVEGH